MRTDQAVPRWLSWNHAIAFALPLTYLVRSIEGGSVFGQDIAAVLLLPWLLTRPGAAAHLRHLRPVLVMLGLWLLGQVVTDLVRDTPREDWQRGWGYIITFGLQIVVLWLLLARRWSLFLAYALGFGIALILNLLVLPNIYAGVPWKFGLGYGLALIAVVLAYTGLPSGKGPGVVRGAVPLLVIAAIALSQNARSTFGTLALAGLFTALIVGVAGDAWWRRRATPLAFGALMLAGLLAAQLVVAGYANLAERGALGDDARQKYLVQSDNDSGILLGGRNESLITLTAIADAPVIGHGSWAKDMYYVRLFYHRQKQSGIWVAGTQDQQPDLIPSHSHLLGAWLWAGVLGGAFWIFIFVLAVRAAYYILRLPDAPHALVALTVFSLAWDLLFSPFGGEVRFHRAFQIVLCTAVVMVARRRRAQASDRAQPNRPPIPSTGRGSAAYVR